MALVVDETCSQCARQFCTTREAQLRDCLKQPICNVCLENKVTERIDGYKAKISKYPREFQLIAYSAAVQKLLIQMCGEEVYWRTVAEQIEE